MILFLNYTTACNERYGGCMTFSCVVGKLYYENLERVQRRFMRLCAFFIFGYDYTEYLRKYRGMFRGVVFEYGRGYNVFRVRAAETLRGNHCKKSEGKRNERF